MAKIASPANTIEESAAFDFPHRLLDEEAVRQFVLSHPSALLRPDLAAERRQNLPEQYKELFEGGNMLCSVSRVAFDAPRTRAVVCLRTEGGGCKSESCHALERLADGSWKILPWSTGQTICA